MTTTGNFSGVTVVDPSGTYSGDEYMDVFYVNDRYPGGAVQDAGVWTVNPMRWFRVPCVSPLPKPVLTLTPSAIEDPAFTTPGVQKDTVVKVENIGNVDMTISKSKLIEADIPILEDRIKNFSYPPHLVLGFLTLALLTLFSVMFPIILIMYEYFSISMKTLTVVLFVVCLGAVVNYIGFQIITLRRK